MPPPRWLQVSWKGCQACGRGCWRVVRWTAWLLLILLIGVQAVVLAKRELHVPSFVLRELETRLAAAGLQAEIGQVTLDPTGRLLLQEVQLRNQLMDTRIARARALYLEINPWLLWLREVEVRNIELMGVELYLPAVMSPSGAEEGILRDLHAIVRPDPNGQSLHIPQANAAVGPLPVTLRGQLGLPASSDPSAETAKLDLAQIMASYFELCRTVADVLPQLPEMTAPHLDVTMGLDGETANTLSLVLQVDRLATPATVKLPTRLVAETVRLHATFRADDLTLLDPVEFSMGQVLGPADLNLRRVFGVADVSLERSDIGPTLGDLQLRIDQLQLPVLDLTDIILDAKLGTLPIVQLEGGAVWFGEPWAVAADLDITNGAGSVNATGQLAAAVRPWLGELTGVNVPELLRWEEAPFLQAEANLGLQGQVLSARAAFQTGPVVARQVPLDATQARVIWDGERILARDIVLRTGPSQAFGSYSMDTKTREFQFLLQGRLDPPDINGWFRDWWPRFFSRFQFKAAPPDASVEVAGVWGDPLATRVFVSADVRDAVVLDIPMERMRTRLFIRPGWADVLHFVADRSVGTVEGGFARQWRMPDASRWTRFEVNAAGVTDLSPTPNLLPRTGPTLIAPFDFASPLKLSLQGYVAREDRGAPIEQDFLIYADAHGPWRLHGFPLADLHLTARHQGSLTRVSDLKTSLAGGDLTGRLKLAGTAAPRKLTFDLNLAEASLGQTIQDVADWTAARNGETAGTNTDYAEQTADGKLNISLAAEGPSTDPLGFVGRGSAAVTNANLANINLLGVLSALLERTILNFSTLQLSNAHANFEVNGPTLTFPELKVTGRRGAMNAVGEYSLAERQLDFTSKVRPFEGGEGLLDAMFSPLSAVLEVKLTGELSDPAWTFVYGPTNLLRNLTGENTRNRPVPHPAPSPSPPRSPPSGPPAVIPDTPPPD